MLPGDDQTRPFQKLRRYWVTTGADVQTTTPGESEIALLEQRYDVQLPRDFRDYLLYSCPLSENNMDGELTCWWPLNRIKNIPNEYVHEIKNASVSGNASKYLFFADYCIWCWAWAIACGDDENRGKVVVINGVSDRIVADSFGQFVDRYINDAQSMA
jgi:SMI1/KNR4 family protein SUKH-1